MDRSTYCMVIFCISGKRRKLPVLAVYNGAEFLRFACLALGIGFSSLTVTTLEQKKKEKLPFPNTCMVNGY